MCSWRASMRHWKSARGHSAFDSGWAWRNSTPSRGALNLKSMLKTGGPKRAGAGSNFPDRAGSTQAGVDLVERRRAGAQLLFGHRIEWCRHRIEMGVQIFRLAVDVEEPGDDLALGGVLLQEGHGADAVVGVVVGTHFLEHKLGAVVLLDHLD